MSKIVKAMEDLEKAFRVNNEEHPIFITRSTPKYRVPQVLREQQNRLQRVTLGYFADMIMYEAVQAIKEDEALKQVEVRHLLPDEAIPLITVRTYQEIENIMRHQKLDMVGAVTHWYNEEILFTAQNIISEY